MTARAPSPNSCRHCGLDRRGRAQQWTTEAGWHTWTPPTQDQILARMRARRDARLSAAPAKYHATTRWTGMAGDPDDEGYALCADCGTDDCPQYWRIQTRLGRQRMARNALLPPSPYDDEPPW